MIIDRISECDLGLFDTNSDVMTSPVNLWSFYGCSSPVPEPNISTGFQSPWSPNSDSEKSRSNAGSPFQVDVENSVNAEAPQDGSRLSNRYQGVRVKNTVKELIMLKRNNDIQTQPHKNENDFPGSKRSAECLSSPSVIKKPATLDNNVLSLYNPTEDIFKECDIYNGFGDVFTSGELSIESVKIQDSPVLDYNPQVPLPTYTATPNPLIPICQMPTGPESPYTSPLQGLRSQQGFGPCGPVAPPVSFFQWQIQQEEEKLANLTPGDLTSKDDDGDTFLHIAVAQGRRALAYVLAKKLANIGMLDVKEHNNQSAFQVSVAANQHLIAQDLLLLGAHVNVMDCWGRSPLHVCAEKGYILTLQAIQRSMENNGQKVDVEAVNYEGLTPLHIAVLSHNAVVQDLSHVTAPESPQTAALMQRRKVLAECISTLLLMGACSGTKDRKSGRSALHMAAEEANVELLRLFLDQPNTLSVINAKAYNGNTPLHLAAAAQGRQAQAHAVQLLMRRGGDPSARNLENEQPLQLVPEGPMGDQVRRILKGRGASARSCPP
ncbi:NF-kappa-B inhibitor zeta isoform X2 [Brachyhypopomus gauderio]|uniref:NF-kappa-B inhibitor zeta isoform X2 n=1 Tax=Brachyhypopomus gauderio TaxID=698409 RepID=UPI0040417043